MEMVRLVMKSSLQWFKVWMLLISLLLIFKDELSFFQKKRLGILALYNNINDALSFKNI